MLAAQAVSFVRTSVERRRPFFLYFAPTAPHVPATPYPGDEDLFDVTDVPKPPSFGTLIEDGPAYLSAARWDPERALRARIVHERQLASMVDVDRAVGSIVDALPSNTIVVYLSDNGMLWGEHRLIGKGVPYNESIRVPMILTALDGRPLPDANRIVLNVDIRETLESAAGLSPRTEGRDWFDPTWTRTAVVLEHLGFDRGTKSPSFCGVRTLDWMYARYRTGEEELYDERSDPYELVNVADAYPNVAAALRRRAENRCDPPPPRYDWTSPPPSPTPTATASPSA